MAERTTVLEFHSVCPPALAKKKKKNHALQILIPRQNSMTNSICHAELICIALSTSAILLQFIQFFVVQEQPGHDYHTSEIGGPGGSASSNPMDDFSSLSPSKRQLSPLKVSPSKMNKMKGDHDGGITGGNTPWSSSKFVSPLTAASGQPNGLLGKSPSKVPLFLSPLSPIVDMHTAKNHHMDCKNVWIFWKIATCHGVFGFQKNLYCVTNNRSPPVCVTRRGSFPCGIGIRKPSKNL